MVVTEAAYNCTLSESVAMPISPESTAAPSHLLTRPKAAAYLAISERKLDQLVASGELNRVKIDACVRFDPDDLDAFIEQHK